MKKILIVNNNMHIGGVQKSLINLLKQIQGEYDITLLLFTDAGEMREEIPASVEVMTLRSPYRYMGMTRQDAKNAGERLRRSIWAAMTRCIGRSTVCHIMALFQKKLGPFDVAVSFLHSGPQKMFYGGCNEFVLDRVKAERKVTFLHCDYQQIHGDHPKNRRIYQRFDGIAACSGGCREAFLRVMPQLEDKVSVVPNCQDYEKIRALAEQENIEPAKGKVTVVTVARFGREKGVLRAIEAIGGLVEKDRLHYVLIGDGVERAKAEQLIQELRLQQVVELKGELKNPYPWIYNADLLLIPSVSEAAPMVIGEAAVLGTPILTTKTSSAQEMVEQTGYGWVCENTIEQIRMGLRRLVNAQQQLQEKHQFLRKIRFDNREAMAAFDRLIE